MSLNTSPGAWMVVYCRPKKSFLFGKRGPQMHKPNLWNLFGGHLDPGESPATGVLRELREESGLTPGDEQVIRLSPEGFSPLGRVCGIREMHYYLMVVQEEVAPTLDFEHSAFGWYRSNTLPHQVNRPTAVALNIGLFVKAATLAAKGTEGVDTDLQDIC